MSKLYLIDQSALTSEETERTLSTAKAGDVIHITNTSIYSVVVSVSDSGYSTMPLTSATIGTDDKSEIDELLASLSGSKLFKLAHIDEVNRIFLEDLDGNPSVTPDKGTVLRWVNPDLSHSEGWMGYVDPDAHYGFLNLPEGVTAPAKGAYIITL